jgi:hypothetical protein
LVTRFDRIGRLALMLPWLLAPTPTRSQQVEAGYVWAASHNAEFPTAKGGQVQGLFELGKSKWRVQLGLHRVWAHTQRESEVCKFYEPPTTCQLDLTRDRVRLTGFRAALVWPLLAGRFADIKLGGGVSLNSMAILSSKGLVSHGDGDIYPPSGSNAGVLGFLRLDVSPAPRTGLAVTLGVLAHWVYFNSCSLTYHRYDPFCSPATFREFQLGVSWVPPRRPKARLSNEGAEAPPPRERSCRPTSSARPARDPASSPAVT